jgi:hypothetical protein
LDEESWTGEEYIAVCVYDLAIASKDPKAITGELIEKYKLDLSSITLVVALAGIQMGPWLLDPYYQDT